MAHPIGFIGLGNMGLPMSRRLLEAGYAVVGCDVRDGVRQAFEGLGGQWAVSPAEAASRCEIVFVSLPTPASVQAVALGDKGLVHGEQIRVYVDLSTTGPLAARTVGEGLAAKGVAVLDAPVSGGVAGAAKGTLSVMASGPRAEFERVEPMLAVFGKNVFYVGDGVGQGQVMKLINNLLSATTLAASCEALSMGLKAGLDPQSMLRVLNASTGRSGATEDKIPRYVLPGKPMGFLLELSFKDVSLAVAAGEGLNVPMSMGHATRQIWHQAIGKGGSDQDMMDVSRCIEDWAGVKLYGCCPESGHAGEEIASPQDRGIIG